MHWDSMACYTLPRSQSDHHPLLLCLNKGLDHYPSSFKFFNMWLEHKDCRKVVEEVWNRPVLDIRYGPMQVLFKKLIALKTELKSWNKEIFGNVQVKVEQAMLKVEEIQSLISENGYSDPLHSKEIEAQISSQQALTSQETFWRDNSRIDWIVQGDRNTAFFHRFTKIKHVSNHLTSLRHGDDILFNAADIEQHILSYSLICTLHLMNVLIMA